MVHLYVVFFLSSILCVAGIEKDFPNILNFTIKGVADPQTIIQSFGYPAETHKVVTEDGYILTLHRISSGIKNAKKKSPVLVMHGIGSSSADFINISPKISLGYILADQGYDVWLGNARGNCYSNRHVRFDPLVHPKQFYNFSWHEIGTIDVPSKIDYILKVTNRKKIHYIGHSQGGTVFYVMGSTKPEYNNKIGLASLLAPAGYIAYIPDPIIHFLAKYVDFARSALEYLSIYHVPFLDLIRSFMDNLCKYDDYVNICTELFLLSSGGYNDGSHHINKSLFQKIFQNTPSDASTKQFIHYFQEIKSGKFQQFDYGAEGNLKVYGQPSPVEYNVTLVTAPVALYYAIKDRFVGVKDIRLMSSRLPHIIKKYQVPYEDFNHIDFLYANDVKFLLYKELLQSMDLYSQSM